jgi:hypothetical protein
MSPFGSKLRFAFVLALLISSFFNRAVAQGRQSGEIRGTVMDQTQALITGVKVTITNVTTGVSHVATTDASGVYDVPFVQPGEYSVTFAKDAFKTLTRSGITLSVETITVNGALEVGAASERVTVSGDAPLVQTESAEKNTTLTAAFVSSAPSINRSWQDLLAALPGVNPGSGENSSGSGVGVNGQERFFSSWQIDGGTAMFGQSSNPNYVSNPTETIQEVSLSTANFGAEHGNGLSVFNVITKSGTNKFHGAVYEYIENDVLNAQNKFAQPPPFNKPAVRWNEYGFNLGGPIKKNKAFFFFSYERNPNHSFGPDLRSYPTTGLQPNGGQGYREGDFSALLGAPAVDGGGSPIINPCNNQQVRQGQIYDPLTTQTVTWNGQPVVCRMPFAGNIIDPSRFDPAAVAIQQNFPIPNVPGAGNVNNYYSTQSNWNVMKQLMSWYNAKVDYDFTPKNRLTASLAWSNYDQSFTRPDCSIDCAHWKGNQPQGQITNVWTISPNVVNEFRFSLSRAYGIATNASSGGGWPSKLGLSNPAGDLFPNIWINGNLNTDIGNPDAPPAIDVETSFVESDAVTWVRGKHILKFGGEFDRWWVNTGWGTATEGGFWWGGVFTQNPVDQGLPSGSVPTEGEGYADFLLGLPNSWWISINPETGGRMWSTQAFVQDEYKVKPNLTLTLGLRYVAQSGWSEVQNRVSGFQPSIKNPADGSMGAMWYGGQYGHTAMTNTIPHFFAPRVGVAWSPKNDWSVRGGFGIYNIFAGQNTIAPAIAWGQGWVPVGNMWCPDSPLFQLGNRTSNWQDPNGGSSNCYSNQFGIGPPSPIYPTNQNRTADLFNGLNVNYTPFNIPMEYYAEYQFDIQHQFAHGVVLDLGYVGNRGFNIQLGRDINQIRLTGPGAGTRPNPNFNQIDASLFDGRGNYNALQIIAKKQFAHGLSFAVNYAWAKVLDTQTGGGWGGSGSSERHSGNYQNAYNMNANYGPASNDIRHTFNGSVTYNLPFGNGKQFLNQGGVLDGIVGGWELSSIFHVRSGVPTTVIVGYDGAGVGSGQWRPNQIADPNQAGPVAANSNIQCQYLAGQPIPNTDLVGIAPARVHTMSSWFNPCAFTTPQGGTFGNVGRDTIYGPNWRTVDLALLKNFRLGLLGEGGGLQFKLSATDVFNHPNLGLTDSTYTDGGFGQISYANTSRQLQVGMKITF